MASPVLVHGAAWCDILCQFYTLLYQLIFSFNHMCSCFSKHNPVLSSISNFDLLVKLTEKELLLDNIFLSKSLQFLTEM